MKKPVIPQEWGAKAPRLTTIAAWINANTTLFAEVEKGYCNTDRKIPGTRLIHPGKGRTGNRLKVFECEDHKWELIHNPWHHFNKEDSEREKARKYPRGPLLDHNAANADRRGAFEQAAKLVKNRRDPTVRWVSEMAHGTMLEEFIQTMAEKKYGEALAQQKAAFHAEMDKRDAHLAALEAKLGLRRAFSGSTRGSSGASVRPRRSSGRHRRGAPVQNADIANASTAYTRAYLPCVVVLSTQIDSDIVTRYRNEQWAILTGSTAEPSTIRSTYAFVREVVGFDLAGFFSRNSLTLRTEVEKVLHALLSA